MSQKASATAIGAFVLGAVVLVVAGLLTFGSGKFFKTLHTYSLYFTGNAKGLNVGAPIGFRGVKIGSVSEIKLIFDISTDEVFIKVTATIDPDAFHEIQSIPGVDIAEGKDPLHYLINKLGLRAKLATLSLVTGQLFIEFDFFPDSPARLYGFESEHAELPTLPSTMEEMQGAIQMVMRTLRDHSLGDIMERLNGIVDGIDRLVNSTETQEIPASLQKTLANMQELAGRLNADIGPLTSSLRQTSDTAGAAFADVRVMLRDEDSERVVRLADSLEKTVLEARKLLKESEDVVASVDTHSVESLVDELARAARSIRIFADYLERHPEAILRGKN